MSIQTLFGILFLLSGIFQAFTAVLIYLGHKSYILRFMSKKMALILHCVLAFFLFFLAYINLV